MAPKRILGMHGILSAPFVRLCRARRRAESSNTTLFDSWSAVYGYLAGMLATLEGEQQLE